MGAAAVQNNLIFAAEFESLRVSFVSLLRLHLGWSILSYGCVKFLRLSLAIGNKKRASHCCLSQSSTHYLYPQFVTEQGLATYSCISLLPIFVRLPFGPSDSASAPSFDDFTLLQLPRSSHLQRLPDPCLRLSGSSSDRATKSTVQIVALVAIGCYAIITESEPLCTTTIGAPSTDGAAPMMCYSQQINPPPLSNTPKKKKKNHVEFPRRVVSTSIGLDTAVFNLISTVNPPGSGDSQH